jgi:hypothetical protein
LLTPSTGLRFCTKATSDTDASSSSLRRWLRITFYTTEAVFGEYLAPYSARGAYL